MNDTDLQGCLAFIREAERLKSVLRSAHTSTGRHESTAEHTWRLCLMAMVFAPHLHAEGEPPLDLARVLQLCVIHDLGEAISGDIPAVEQAQVPDKSARERADLLTLMAPLPEDVRERYLALWEDYEHARTPEARVVKALDKLETILQHNQGANPASFDYAFNLVYGAKVTRGHPLIERIRAAVDADTRRHALERGQIDGSITAPAGPA
ncbi:HD domain-containing protein [Sphaerotilus mobilis]|nr:HD domain-containing protein [Sphaerotilus mobilis]